VTEYIDELNELRDQLAAMGRDIDDVSHTARMLCARSLPDSWKSTLDTLRMITTDPELVATIPKCTNCKRKGHSINNCWSPGGGKEGQYPSHWKTIPIANPNYKPSDSAKKKDQNVQKPSTTESGSAHIASWVATPASALSAEAPDSWVIVRPEETTQRVVQGVRRMRARMRANVCAE
jgi:hypothetical protein